MRNGIRITANQFAKFLVSEMGERSDYWRESNDHVINVATLSDRQELEIDRCIKKQQERVEKILSADKIRSKIVVK